MNTWIKLEINSQNYIIQFVRDTQPVDSTTCWLSDFNAIWNETFHTTAGIMKRIKDENPLLLSTEIEQMLMNTITVIPKTTGKQSTEQIKLNQIDDCMRLQLKYYLSDDVPLKFFWNLKKCEPNAFFNMITKPMLKQIGNLQQNNQHLMDIIKKKDLEIEQYKLDGAAPLIRKQFVTKPFDVKQLTEESQMFDCLVSEFSAVYDAHNQNSSNENVKNRADGSSANELTKEACTSTNTGSLLSKPTQINKMKRNSKALREFEGIINFPFYENVDDESDTDNDNNSSSTKSNGVESTLKKDNCSSSSRDNSSEKKTNGTAAEPCDSANGKNQVKRIRKKLNL